MFGPADQALEMRGSAVRRPYSAHTKRDTARRNTTSATVKIEAEWSGSDQERTRKADLK